MLSFDAALTLGMRQADTSDMVKQKTFLEAWNQAHPQTSVTFEEDVFWRTLYPHAILFSWVMWRLWPAYFARDLDFIRRLSSVTSANEMRFEIDNFRYQNPEYGLLRGRLRLRVSGKRVLHLAKRMMRPEEPTVYSLT